MACNGGRRGNLEFSFRLVDFDMHIRNPCGDVEAAIMIKSAFRKEKWAIWRCKFGSSHLPKTIDLDEIPEECV